MNARERLRIMIRSTCGSMTVWSQPEIDDAFAAYDAEHRAEVLAEAGLLPTADVVAWLTKKAREGTPVEVLASKAARGAIRPDNLRMLPADFFEPGRTYVHGEYRFRCEYLTCHPTSGQVAAWGWFGRNGGWRHTSFSRRQFEVREWTDVTEAEPAAVSQHFDKVPDPLDGCHWCACGNRWPCKDAGQVTA